MATKCARSSVTTARGAGGIRQLVEGCDVVFHLAALIGIPYSYRAPQSYVDTNVSGTLNLLDACRQAGTRRLIVTSTSEVYGTAQTVPMTEKHPLSAQSPYAASKIAADKLAESYHCAFGLPVVTMRPFNTYGPRQSARAIIPTVLCQALHGAGEIRLGNLTPQRDLTFVDDTVKAFQLAATRSSIEGETIHFGQGAAISVGELAERCLGVTESKAKIVTDTQRQRPTASEVDRLVCDAGKAQSLLGWAPQVSLEEGLRRTAEYIRLNPHRYRPSEYTV
jgi:dTDP-glucose 4,6-dehydratase